MERTYIEWNGHSYFGLNQYKVIDDIIKEAANDRYAYKVIYICKRIMDLFIFNDQTCEIFALGFKGIGVSSKEYILEDYIEGWLYKYRCMIFVSLFKDNKGLDIRWEKVENKEDMKKYIQDYLVQDYENFFSTAGICPDRMSKIEAELWHEKTYNCFGYETDFDDFFRKIKE